MAFAIQLDFFEPCLSENDLLRAELKMVRESADKVRKGTYAEIGKLKKTIVDLQERLALIERNICKPQGIKALNV